jgi:hypothetical protein
MINTVQDSKICKSNVRFHTIIGREGLLGRVEV